MRTNTSSDHIALTSDDEFLTTEELALRTKSSRRTWEGRRRKGGTHTPKFIKLGKGNSARILYRWSAVLDWLEQQTRQSTTEG